MSAGNIDALFAKRHPPEEIMGGTIVPIAHVIDDGWQTLRLHRSRTIRHSQYPSGSPESKASTQKQLKAEFQKESG